MQKLKAFFGELFRRKVARLLGAYLVLLWLLAQGFAALYPAFGLPPWSLQAFVITGLSLVPVLAILSWKYDLVLPQLVRDRQDVAASSPGHKFAALRHDGSDAGTITLRWTTKEETTCEQRFFKPVAIGREPGNELELEDQRVSRYHAVIWAERGCWHVRDLDSANGTFLDGERVQGSVKLPVRGELRFHAEGPKVSVFILTSAATIMQVPGMPTLRDETQT